MLRRDMLQHSRRLAQGRNQRLEADPSPIDPVVGDQAVLKVHDLDEIDLVALRRLARILPHQLAPIGEERVGAIPAAEIVTELAKPGLEEGPDLAPSLQN